VELAEALIGKGAQLRIYDPDVAIGQVFGRNKAYIDARLPHVAQLFGGSLAEVVRESDVVIVGKRVSEIENLPQLLTTDQTIIDLVGIDGLTNAVRPWSASLAPVGLLA
jgi:GDP-mannose 6-dehydrogenase